MAQRTSLDRTTLIHAPIERIFPFFSDPRNLARLTPPSLGFRIISCPDRTLREGDRIVYSIRLMGVRVRWITRITEWVDGIRFADFQERGPYRYWLHEHAFERAADGVLMTDHVEYDLPLGVAGRIAGGWFVRSRLRSIFEFRAKAITAVFGETDERIDRR